MTIRTLLDQCTVEDIVSSIMQIASVDESDRPGVYETHAAFVEHLKTLDPIDTGHIVFGLRYMDEGKVSPDASLFSKAEIMEQFDPESELKSITEESALSDDEVDRLSHLRFTPESYAFEFTPWTEVLGYEVFQPNVKEYGAAAILASVIYEMTFFGFTQEEQDEERAKLDEAIAESEAIRKLTPEEQKKHYKTAEEVFAELGYVDERTEEEKEQERRALCRDVLYNHLQTYRVLRDYYCGRISQ